MAELHDRFHRLDRIATPDLWHEAVGRAAELDAAPRRGFNPAMALVAAALLMAALVGTIAVGGWVNQPEADPLSVVYSNGVLAAYDRCGRIVGIDPSTSVVRELVAPNDDRGCGPASVTDLEWSADGHLLAYVVARSEHGPSEGDGYEVRVRDGRTGTESLVQSCANCWDVDISPDGSLVTYIDYTDDRGSELIAARTDGSSIHRIPFLGLPGEPVFSPDGETIAIPLTGGTSGVHVLDVSNLEETDSPTMRLLHGPVASSRVSWSPDGEWLAFDKHANGEVSEVWAVRRNGTDARLLASGPGPAGPAYPIWSADSSTVAYVSTPDGPQIRQWSLEVWTATLDGETNRIYQSGCCLRDFAEPTWSPDGEWIALGIEAEEGASGSGLYLVRPDGSDLHRLSTFARQPAWQSLVADR